MYACMHACTHARTHACMACNVCVFIYICVYTYIIYLYIYIIWNGFVEGYPRSPQSLSFSLSLAYKNVKAQLKNRSKAIVLPFLFSDENRMMQSQRDNESIMEWNVLSSCTWFRDLRGSLSNLPLVRLHRDFFCWPQKVPMWCPQATTTSTWRHAKPRALLPWIPLAKMPMQLRSWSSGWFLVQYVQYWSVLFNHSLGS